MANRILLLILLILCVENLSSQPKYNNNWYFGQKAAIDFNSNPPLVRNDNQLNVSGNGSSISDPVSGKLLFYTNGNSFWNSFGEMIDSSYSGNVANDMVILPLKRFRNRFIVFNFSSYYIVDMEARGGRGAILKKQDFPLRTSVNRMTAVKHCLSESYWLITIDGYFFCAYLVHPDGSIEEPVTTAHHAVLTTAYLGDFVSSNNGEKLAFTCYAPSGATYFEPQIFDFDKRCGKVSPTRTILPMESDWDRPHGIAFSPDDRLVYVSYGLQESHLVQYDVNNPNDYRLIATSPSNFNQIACGPDGKLYVTTHIGGIPSNKLDAVLNPNVKGAGCNYRENYLRLSGIPYFEVPNLVINHTGSCRQANGFSLEADKGTCQGQQINFTVKGNPPGIDSVRWFFNDPLDPGLESTSLTASHIYADIGNYRPQAVIFFCDFRDTFFFTVSISKPDKFPLGNDTILCANDSLRVGHIVQNSLYLWNTGHVTAHLTVRDPGTYIREVNRQGCKSADTIVVTFHPSLKLLLGDAYYICEEEKELVRLDAGKGFRSYLWYPSSDTSHWIEVDKRGGYYVVVRDYRGCRGDDRTIVESRCELRVFIPNAFSPNADGLNDTLMVVTYNENDVLMQVYSAWGELIYEGPNGWDGSFNGQLVQQGVYLLKVKVTGFINKQPAERFYSNLFHVLN
jgi:gliding motility-associated-like protein